MAGSDSTGEDRAVWKDGLRRRASALVVAACYLAFGLVWILFSDHLGTILFTTQASLTTFQSWKGGGFVLLSAGFLYLALAAPRRPREDFAPSALLPPALRTSSRQRWPVVVLLSLLVLATALPMVALLGFHIVRDTRDQMEDANRLVLDVASDTAGDVAMFFASQQRIAASLAQRDAVRTFDPTACDPLLPEIAAVNEMVFEISTFRADGSLACGRSERGNMPPPDWLETLRRTRAPMVSPIARDGLAGIWRFAVVQPVVGADGALLGAIEMVLPVSALQPLVAAPLPRGGAVTLVDPLRQRAGRIPGGAEYIGTAVTDRAVIERVTSMQPVSTTEVTGPDGVRRQAGVAPIGSTGWFVVAGVPLDSIYAPAQGALLRSLLVGLGVVALCAWLVVRIGRSITEPLQALRRTAAGAASGDFSVRAPESGAAELAAVAAGFNQMLEQLPHLQRELRASEIRNRSLLDKISNNVPGAIFMIHIDADGKMRIPFASRALQTVFDLSPAEVMDDASPAFDRVHPMDRGRIDRLVAEAARSLTPVVAEYRLLLPSSGVRHVLGRALPEAMPDGSVMFYVSVTDVSTLHEARLALAEANGTLEQRIGERTAELAQANEALESFSYSVAHDLRAPLASIEGFGQAMLEALGRGDPVRAGGYAERVVANAARMDLLIEGFLALARAGREPLVDTPVDLQRLVAEVLADLPHPPQARIDVQPLPRVHGDQATLRQVWHNLLSNAFKYSSRRERPVVSVSCKTAPGGELVFTVGDNGAGFDPAYADKLFTPFARLHKADEFEGTGVGLALVRRIVERHGGRIWARSSLDEGATFSFTLPRERLLAALAVPAGARG